MTLDYIGKHVQDISHMTNLGKAKMNEPTRLEPRETAAWDRANEMLSLFWRIFAHTRKRKELYETLTILEKKL